MVLNYVPILDYASTAHFNNITADFRYTAAKEQLNHHFIKIIVYFDFKSASALIPTRHKQMIIIQWRHMST